VLLSTDIFAMGYFSGAEDVETPYGYIIWNGTSWATVDFPFYSQNSLLADLVAVSNGTEMWVYL
jgi:hypothetical protein